jgi:hypothetical protein
MSGFILDILYAPNLIPLMDIKLITGLHHALSENNGLIYT